MPMVDSKGKNVAIIAPSTTRRAYPLHLPNFPPPESRGAVVESYPMSSPNDKGYDELLLAQAPEVTKADLQGGYNPDILIAPRPPSSRVRSPDPDAEPRDIESAGSTSPPREKYHPAQPKSFWKTRKGIIVITSLFILVAVILGAVLGGVLGTRKHGHKTDTSAPSAPDGGNSQGSGMGDQNEGSPQGTPPSSSNGSMTTSAQQPAGSLSDAGTGTSNSGSSQSGGTGTQGR